MTDLKPTTKEEVLEAVAGVDAIFWAHKFRVDKEIFDAAGEDILLSSTRHRYFVFNQTVSHKQTGSDRNDYNHDLTKRHASNVVKS